MSGADGHVTGDGVAVMIEFDFEGDTARRVGLPGPRAVRPRCAAARTCSRADRAANQPAASWAPHPAFGHIAGTLYGVFIYKRFDHHLRQFGA